MLQAKKYIVVGPYFNIGFNADLEPAFYLNSDPDPRTQIQGVKPMRIHADPDPGQILKSHKVTWKKYLK